MRVHEATYDAALRCVGHLPDSKFRMLKVLIDGTICTRCGGTKDTECLICDVCDREIDGEVVGE